MFRLPQARSGAYGPSWAGAELSLLSAIRYGVRWQHQARAAAWLRSEGWHFLSLLGDYKEKSRSDAYRLFIDRVDRAHEATELSYLDLFARIPQDEEKRGNR
jgi:hypothetical protein